VGIPYLSVLHNISILVAQSASILIKYCRINIIDKLLAFSSYTNIFYISIYIYIHVYVTIPYSNFLSLIPITKIYVKCTNKMTE